MARLMGRMPLTSGEKFVYDFAMKSLPDYIYVAFSVVLPVSGREIECDALLLIPHLGVVAMEIKDACRILRNEGKMSLWNISGVIGQWNRKQLRNYHFAICSYLQEKFEVSPYVYSILCLPNCSDRDVPLQIYSDVIYPDELFLREDFEDSDRFLLKMQRYCAAVKKSMSAEARDKYLLCDLSDRMAYNIFYYWDTGIKKPERPARPPLLFLSYNRNNSVVAEEIKEQLEQRGIFVWRAPEDVEVGEYYLPAEMAAIGLCDAFLILLSTPAQESYEVQIEFEKARELGKKILPVLVEECTLTEYYQNALREYQYIHLLKPDAVKIEEIARKVTEASTVQQSSGCDHSISEMSTGSDRQNS